MAWSVSETVQICTHSNMNDFQHKNVCKTIDINTRTCYTTTKQEDKTMKLEFRTKNTAYGMAHYLCIDTNAKTFSRVPDGWVSKGMPTVSKRDMDTLKAQAIADGYKEV